MGKYIPKINKLPNYIYRTTVDFIRGYDEMESELEDMIMEKHVEEIPVKNKTPGNPTAKTAERRERKLAKVKAIDKAFNTVPAEYQGMLFDNIVYETPMEEIEGASRATLTRYRVRIIVEAAHNLEFIDDIEYGEIKTW